ncbi:hypothetical protein LTR66_015384 [Elasticomyces elasticus]|nr:hypothetical protein LTR66_015384 [Elasticomyces elasticus]
MAESDRASPGHNNSHSSTSSDNHTTPCKHSQHHHIPNPFTAAGHIAEDHYQEFKYGHQSRQAKREAQKLDLHHSKPHKWSIEHAADPSGDNKLIDEIESKAMDAAQTAWQEELNRRAHARTMSWSQEAGVARAEAQDGTGDHHEKECP